MYLRLRYGLYLTTVNNHNIKLPTCYLFLIKSIIFRIVYLHQVLYPQHLCEQFDLALAAV